MKSYTDLLQSKKLAEFLPIESADMHYSPWTIFDYEFFIASLNYGNTIEDLQEDYGNQIIPCWSLSALLDILPMLNDRTPIISITFDKKYRVVYHSTAYEREIITSDYDNPIDACYEMIFKLKEQKLL